MNNETTSLKNFGQLVTAIENVNSHFLNQVKKQVNTALTLRNWFIGQHIMEYEQKGEDRAKYGEGLLKQLAAQLVKGGLKSFSDRNLYLCKAFLPGVSKHFAVSDCEIASR